MSGSNNVVKLRANELPAFGLASVHSAGRALSGSRNSVRLCPAYSGPHECMLYVKPRLTTRQMVAELLCAQIALAMGLPCPKP